MYNFTAEQVRSEIEQLIAEMPHNDGSLGSGEYDDDKQCVYFLDETGRPFGGEMYNPSPVDENRQFDQPVCIVGHWVHRFHPELKNDEDFKFVLQTNAIVGTSEIAKRVLPLEVIDVLKSAQYQQDEAGAVWANIDLDTEGWWQ
jgi:hypothetical protein